MKRTYAAAFTLLIALSASTLSAKGITTRITIEGSDLAAPVLLADPILLQQFNVWAGRGTRMNGVEGNDGFIIDWPSGTIPTPPSALREYTVSFFVTYPRRSDEQLAYKVLYRRDPSGGGYVYLPGREHQWYPLNTRAILRGCEGQWFRSTAAWEQAVDWVIASNTARR
jgi:hypothetical protein